MRGSARVFQSGSQLVPHFAPDPRRQPVHVVSIELFHPGPSKSSTHWRSMAHPIPLAANSVVKNGGNGAIRMPNANHTSKLALGAYGVRGKLSLTSS